MSASKRTRRRLGEWPQPSELPDPPASFQKDVLKYAGAKAAFARVISPRSKDPTLNEDLVWRQLWELACREDEHSRWYEIPGLPLHKLRRFPETVRGWAKEIRKISEQIQSSRAYGYSRALLPSLESWARNAKMVEAVKGRRRVISEALARKISTKRSDLPKLVEIPDLLDLYANCTEAVYKITAHYAPRTPARYKVGLISPFAEHAKRVSLRDPFPDIATLLTAVYSVRGSNKIVNPRTLGAQYNRHFPRNK